MKGKGARLAKHFGKKEQNWRTNTWFQGLI